MSHFLRFPSASNAHRHAQQDAQRSLRWGVVAALTALALAVPGALPGQSSGGGSAPAGGDDSLILVPLVPPKPADIVGVWSYQTSQPSVAGPCPAGMALSGEVSISYDTARQNDPANVQGGPVAIDILSGSRCDPAAMCHLHGMIAGTGVVAGAFAVADDEGGQAATAWSLYFTSATEADGTAIANYTHPSGMECDWGMRLTLSRPEPE